MLVVRSSTNKKRNIILVLLGVVILAGAVIGIMAVKNIGPFAKSEENTRSSESKSSEKSDEEDAIEEPAEDQIPADGRNPSGEGGDKPVSNDNPVDSGVFTSSIDAVVDSDSVRLSTIIQRPANSGTCALTLTSDSKTITKQAGVQQLGGNSTCQGFTISRSELSSGRWNAKLVITLGQDSSNSETEFTL